MQFAHSIWLVAGVATCTALALSFRHLQRRNRTALKKFASGHLLEKLTESVSPARRMTKQILFILSVGCIFIALAQPQIGFRWEEIKRKGIDILMAVDTSRSMLANDVKPNRLERSKLGIMDFVSELNGDRVGLIPFAGTAFLMCPLTMDYDAFRQSLTALDTNTIPQGGTDLASAIYEAHAAFTNDANHKILILMTDGEDLEGNALSAAQEAKAKGMTIYTVGVGTPGGELIPIETQGKGVSFVKDETGRMVKSRLDEKTLKDIAEATGGAYEPLGRQAQGLETIYSRKLSLVPKHELAERMQKVPINRFEWPLALAFVLLLIEFILSDRRRKGPLSPEIKTADRRPRSWTKATIATIFGSLFTVSLVLCSTAWASPQSAEKAYKKGDFSQASTEYRAAVDKDPEDCILRFNLGTASYKDRKYKEAFNAFKDTLASSELPLQNKTYYNLGNTLYRMGQQIEKTKPENTIKQWQAAISAYDGALKLNADDKDALFNKDFVKKKLEELKKKQKNNKDNKNNKKKDNKDKNKDDKNDDKKDKGDQNKKPGSKGNDTQGKSNRQDKGDPESGDKEKKQNGDKKDKRTDNNKAEQGMKKAALPEARNNSKVGNSEGKPQERKPGQMTREEAKNLLDSLKGDEKSMPLSPDKGRQSKHDEMKRRNW